MKTKEFHTLQKYFRTESAVTMKVVLLVSGGMDSLVTTAITAAAGLDLAAMHVNY